MIHCSRKPFFNLLKIIFWASVTFSLFSSQACASQNCAIVNFSSSKAFSNVRPSTSLNDRKITGHWFIHFSHSILLFFATFSPSNIIMLSFSISKKDANILIAIVFPNLLGLVISVTFVASYFRISVINPDLSM